MCIKPSKLTLFNSHLASQWLLEHFKFLRISKRHVSGKQFKDSSCSVFDVEDAVDGFFDVDVEVDFATSTPNSISLFTIARIWSLSSFVSRELTQTKASILIRAKLECNLQPVLWKMDFTCKVSDVFVEGSFRHVGFSKESNYDWFGVDLLILVFGWISRDFLARWLSLRSLLF